MSLPTFGWVCALVRFSVTANARTAVAPHTTTAPSTHPGSPLATNCPSTPQATQATAKAWKHKSRPIAVAIPTLAKHCLRPRAPKKNWASKAHKVPGSGMPHCLTLLDQFGAIKVRAKKTTHAHANSMVLPSTKVWSWAWATATSNGNWTRQPHG